MFCLRSQPVYDFLTSSGCDGLIFLWSADVFRSQTVLLQLSPEKPSRGKSFLSLSVDDKRIWADLHSEEIGDGVGIEVMWTDNSASH